MSSRPFPATLALTAAFGCTLNIGPDTGETASGTGTTSGTDTGATTSEPGTATTSATPTTTVTSTSETSETGTTTGTSGTTGEVAPDWCHGLDPAGPATLTVANGENVDIVDGTPLPVICGGQGSLMIPIYPHFGGFIPDGDSVGFDVILDVEGFNLGADGHFFAAVGHSHRVNCTYEDPYYYGYSYAFIPIFPPDAIPEIAAIDGKPGVLHVTLYSPIGDMKFEADVILSAAEIRCGYGGYDTDTDGDTDGNSSGGSTT